MKITKSDIPAKFLFILEMYKALDNYLEEVNKSDWWDAYKPYEAKLFEYFMVWSFWFKTVKQEKKYWIMIADQDEPAIRAYNNISPLTLINLYDIAYWGLDYNDFESQAKSKLSGLPVTQAIDEEIVISLKK